MNFDKAKFKSIYEELIFNNETDNAKIANNLLQLGWLMGQSSLALNHSNEDTCAIHERSLLKYRNVAVKELNYSKDNGGGCYINNILNPDDYTEYVKQPCRSEYLDCDNDKISKADIEALLKTTPETQNGQANKRFCVHSETENSVNKFVFRETKPNSIIRSPPAVQLNTVKHNESYSKLFNSFGSKPQTNTVNYPGTRDFKESSGIDRVFQPNPRPNPENRQNSMQSSNRQPFFSFDKTKKVGSQTDRETNGNSFITAREELHRQTLIKNGQNPSQASNTPLLLAYGTSTKTLGMRRTVHSKFVPPIPMEQNNEVSNGNYCTSDQASDQASDIDERLKNIDPKMVELIRSEIMDQSSPVDWDDIAGLEYAKTTIQEAVIWPLLRPDIFTGLRAPPRGILLFGPPGTGKTLIGRCIAARSQSTFFSISASSLTSKWIGDGEKMVRALFAVANVHQPAVIFIDEIDSLLSQRSDTEHESSRRLKTEFLVQLDGARTTGDEKILIVGATNRPQELDEAARRRLTKRLYIPLPELNARIQILSLLLKKERNQMGVEEITEIGRLTDGFSGADMKTLCHEALMGPIRSIRLEDMQSIDVNDVRLVNFTDFTNALRRVRASVSKGDLVQYEKWDSTYGLGAPE